MEQLIKANWWAWWGNPLMCMSSDKRKQYQISEYYEDQLSYSKILEIRKDLGLYKIPEAGIVDDHQLGNIALLSTGEHTGISTWLPAVTFDQSILQMSQTEWEEVYGLSDKGKIRIIIQQSRAIPEKLQKLSKEISAYIDSNFPKEKDSLVNRTLAVLCIYYSFRFPIFSKRWHLSLPDFVTKVIDHIDLADLTVVDEFCNFVSDELREYMKKIDEYFSIPQLDFTADIDGSEAIQANQRLEGSV